MDPNAAWRRVCTDIAHVDRAQAALDLLVWLARGGFPPDGVNREVVIVECESLFTDILDGSIELED